MQQRVLRRSTLFGTRLNAKQYWLYPDGIIQSQFRFRYLHHSEIPRHYLTERGILFSRKEIDEWLMERRSPLDV